MKKTIPLDLSKPVEHSMPIAAAEPSKTIAHTIAEHQNDPRHRFHAPGKQSDGRASVAAGERLQRVRGRAKG